MSLNRYCMMIHFYIGLFLVLSVIIKSNNMNCIVVIVPISKLV